MKWLADENFRRAIVRGLLRRSPGFDILRAQDVDQVSGEDDVTLLAWATRNDRILLTHDLSTMIFAIRQQLQRESRCTAVVLVPDSLPVGSVIEDILLLEDHALESDWLPGVVYLPLR